jgi:formylglycine-generating enzyme required for sulfatase activity
MEDQTKRRSKIFGAIAAIGTAYGATISFLEKPSQIYSAVLSHLTYFSHPAAPVGQSIPDAHLIVPIDAAVHDVDTPIPPLPPGMARVEGATFEMGSTAEEVAAAKSACRRDPSAGGRRACGDEVFAREQPAHAVRLSSFFMDRHETSNAEFVQWLRGRGDLRRVPDTATNLAHIAAGDHTVAVLYDSRYPLTRTSGVVWTGQGASVRPGFDQYPVVLVPWAVASSYCIDHGRRLPTEAEWELAARGAQRRLYPWGGDAPRPGATIVSMPSADPPFGRVPSDAGDRAQDRTPDGIFDLGGNVSEWVEDVVAPYQACAQACPNPRFDIATGHAPERVVRGGGYRLGIGSARGAARGRAPANSVNPDVGFRCVAAIP